MKTWPVIAAMVCALLTRSVCLADEESVVDTPNAQSVWLAVVDEMYESDVVLPEWLQGTSDGIVVKGVLDGGRQSAMSLAIHDTILPRLMEEPTSPWSEEDQALAIVEIQHQLQHSGLILRRFEQPYYKTVDGERFDAFTREALLLDLSDKRVEQLRHRVHRSIHGNKRFRATTMRLSIGLIVAIFVTCWIVYRALDRLTRGYYVGWLRLAALTTFLISAGVTFHLARVIIESH